MRLELPNLRASRELGDAAAIDFLSQGQFSQRRYKIHL
jgi:hypothetical protein